MAGKFPGNQTRGGRRGGGRCETQFSGDEVSLELTERGRAESAE